MEYYQAIQNRAAQTVAVINQYLPNFKIGSVTAADLISQSDALNALAQTRDDRLAGFDAANNAENQGFLLIRGLGLSLPQAAEGDLDDGIPAESALLDLFAPAYAVVPRTTESALERGKKVMSALTKTNAYLAGLAPARGPITSGGKGAAQLSAAMAAQPALEQALEDRAADTTGARTDLRVAATALDRLNKRAYQKLQGEARTNPALADALGQIVTDSANQPGTLGIRGILQGGADGLHLLVSYDNGSFDGMLESKIEWQVAGTDADFTHNAPVDPSGNALGPFAAGQTVKIRTSVKNGNGTTTGSVRTITLLAVV